MRTISLFIGAILLSFAASTWADGGQIKSLTKNQYVYGQLGGNWWEWGFDTNFAQFGWGEVDCTVGQSGSVWFLAGTFGGIAERSCTVPHKKSLFIPLVNSLSYFEEGVDPIEFDLSVDEKRIWLDGRIGGGSLFGNEAVAALATLLGAESNVACDLHAILDGEPVVFTTPIVRGQSGPVTITTDDEAIADGYYVLLPPLEIGLHYLQFGGGTCAVTDGSRLFETSTSYTLSVVK